MDQDSKEQEFISPAEEEKPWKWEIIKDPIQRQRIIADTIEERVIQEITGAVGQAEIAASDLPQFVTNRQLYASIAKENALIAAQQLQRIQWVLRMDPKQKLPIDRKTYASSQKAIIVLDQVPNPDTQLNPPQRTNLATRLLNRVYRFDKKR